MNVNYVRSRKARQTIRERTTYYEDNPSIAPLISNERRVVDQHVQRPSSDFGSTLGSNLLMKKNNKEYIFASTGSKKRKMNLNCERTYQQGRPIGDIPLENVHVLPVEPFELPSFGLAATTYKREDDIFT